MHIEHTEHQQREGHRDRCEHMPLWNANDRRGEFELRMTLDVVDAPVGSDRTFITGLPRLIEGLQDVVAHLLFVRPRQEAAQEQRLVRHRSDRAGAIAPFRGPANLTDDHGLLRERGLHGLELAEAEVDRRFHVDALPVGEQVHRNEVHVTRDLRVLEQRRPGVGVADRLADRAARAIEDS